MDKYKKDKYWQEIDENNLLAKIDLCYKGLEEINKENSSLEEFDPSEISWVEESIYTARLCQRKVEQCYKSKIDIIEVNTKMQEIEKIYKDLKQKINCFDGKFDD